MNEPISIEIYALVEGLRKQVKQADKMAIAKATGLSRQGVESFASGRTQGMTTDTLQKLCDYFGIRIIVEAHKHALPPIWKGE